jgi:putative Ca2+/H+ antiporter (TMEM165/GDT1 family)
MDLKTIMASFVLIFLAELGDKTQLAVLLFASKSGRERFPWEVCIGAGVALVLATFIAAALGYAGKELIPGRVIHYVAAAGFVGVGIWMFFSKA